MRKSETVLAHHIVDHTMILTVMADMPCCCLHHTFIALKKTTHILKEVHIALRAAAFIRKFSSVKLIKIKALKDHFCPGKDAVTEKHFPVGSLT